MSNTNTFLGNSGITAIYLGNTPIVSAYCGTNLIFPTIPVPSGTNYRLQFSKDVTVSGSPNTVIVCGSTGGTYWNISSMYVNGVMQTPSTAWTFTTSEFNNGQTIIDIGITTSSSIYDVTAFSESYATAATAYTDTILKGLWDINRNLKNITFTASSTKVNDRAFKNNPLTSITGSEKISYVGEEAFRNCQFTSLTLENLTQMETFAFEDCKNLEYVRINVWDSSANEGIIEWGAFENNTSLKEVVIGDKVTKIKGPAFGNIDKYYSRTLKTIRLECDTWPILTGNTSATYQCFYLASNGNLFVPRGITGTSWLTYSYEDFINKNWTINYI